MRKYSNIGTDREALFLVSFRLLGLVGGVHELILQHREHTRKERSRTERERKRKKEQREFNEREKANHKHYTKERKKHRKDSLLSHHGEPRSGGNLERVTREERERGAFLIVCCGVFSLPFLSLLLSERSARKNVRFGDSVPFNARLLI